MKSNLLPKTSDTTQEKLNTLLAEQKQTNPIQPLTKDPRNLVRRTGSAFARMFNIYTQNYGNDEGSIPHQERFLIAKKDSLEAKDRLTKLTVLKTDIKYAKTNQKAIKDINYGIDENASPTQIYWAALSLGVQAFFGDKSSQKKQANIQKADAELEKLDTQLDKIDGGNRSGLDKWISRIPVVKKIYKAFENTFSFVTAYRPFSWLKDGLSYIDSAIKSVTDYIGLTEKSPLDTATKNYRDKQTEARILGDNLPENLTNLKDVDKINSALSEIQKEYLSKKKEDLLAKKAELTKELPKEGKKLTRAQLGIKYEIEKLNKKIEKVDDKINELSNTKTPIFEQKENIQKSFEKIGGEGCTVKRSYGLNDDTKFTGTVGKNDINEVLGALRETYGGDNVTQDNKTGVWTVTVPKGDLEKVSGAFTAYNNSADGNKMDAFKEVLPEVKTTSEPKTEESNIDKVKIPQVNLNIELIETDQNEKFESGANMTTKPPENENYI